VAGLGGALGTLRQTLFSASLSIALLGFATFAALAGIAFLLVGAYVSLAERLPDWQAGLIVGASAALVAAVTLLWVRFRMLPGPSGRASSVESLAHSETVKRIDEAVALARRLSRTKPQASDVAAAGFIAGILVGMGSGEHSRSGR
jgi:hypothetical protein